MIDADERRNAQDGNHNHHHHKMNKGNKTKRNFTGRHHQGFFVDGKLLPKPSQGWASASIHTPHGKRLVQIYKQGVSIALSPTWIYQTYPELRCVEHGSSFRKFKANCIKAYQAKNTSSPFARTSSDTESSRMSDVSEEEDYNSSSSEEEFSG